LGTYRIWGDYFSNKKFRVIFQTYLNRMWEEKDTLITSLMDQNAVSAVPVPESETVEGAGGCREMAPDMLHS
jgi:hypothetical protein